MLHSRSQTPRATLHPDFFIYQVNFTLMAVFWSWQMIIALLRSWSLPASCGKVSKFVGLHKGIIDYCSNRVDLTFIINRGEVCSLPEVI